MKGNFKYFASSFIWSSIAKILNAALKFISIPLLLKYFGKDSYGLIALAVSTNAYIQLLNMGMNTGAIKFFSQWIALKDYGRIDRVARTNLTVYIGLGIVNSILLLLLVWKGDSVFKITSEEFHIFRYLLIILAGTCIINWTAFVFNQLLIADEKIALTQKILSIRSILNLVIVLLTIHYKLSIIQYFLYDSILSMVVVIPYYISSKKRNLIRSLFPGFYWNDFAEVFKYSLAIFALSIFQFTATQSRPLVLGMFSNQGTSILADYRVIEVFPIFIISIGGMLISIMLPKTSKAIHNNDRTVIEKIAYEGTKYTSILVSILCFPIILSARELLNLYVGDEYIHLSIWLILWIFTLSLSLFNSPIASLVLATGKTRMLVYNTAVSCIISIVINALLCNILGVGSAVVGYFVYIIIQEIFYFFYFNNKVLELNSLKVFKSFVFPTATGLILMILIMSIKWHISSLILMIVLKSALWIMIYLLLLVMFKMIEPKKISAIIGHN